MVEIFVGFGAFIGGLGLGWYLKGLKAQKDQALLAAQLESTREKLKLYEDLPAVIAKNLKETTAEALKSNTEYFLKLAREIFQEKERTLSNLTQPLAENLTALREELNRLERQREAAHRQLEEKLRALVQEHLPRLSEETRLLKKLFEIPQSRGQWGEIQLRRLVELAGLLEHCDFKVQKQLGNGARPDLLVYLPGNRLIAVDAKAPLPQGDGFAKTLRQHIDALARKSYWEAIKTDAKRSPEFVVLFLPAESLLAQAYQEDAGLLEYAAHKGVILATPLTLLSMLKAVALGWQEEAFLKNAEEIIRTGQELHQRFHTFARHLNELGRSIEKTVAHFNQTVASFKKRLLPAARRFEGLKVVSSEINPPKELEISSSKEKLDL